MCSARSERENKDDDRQRNGATGGQASQHHDGAIGRHGLFGSPALWRGYRKGYYAPQVCMDPRQKPPGAGSGCLLTTCCRPSIAATIPAKACVQHSGAQSRFLQQERPVHHAGAGQTGEELAPPGSLFIVGDLSTKPRNRPLGQLGRPDIQHDFQLFNLNSAPDFLTLNTCPRRRNAGKC